MIYSSLNDDEELSLISYFVGTPYDSDTRTQFVFANKVSVKKLKQSIRLDAILLGAYKGIGNNNYGFPTGLNILASNDDNEELTLKATFQGQPGDPSIYQLTLREPICCTRLEIEVVSFTTKKHA